MKTTQGRRGIEHEELLRNVSYYPESGIFVRLINTGPRGCHKAGRTLGIENGQGYLKFSVGGCEYYAHRLAWFYVNGEWPKHQIDHINGCRHDNRIDNLRSVGGRINAQNRTKPASHSKSGVLGVHYCELRGKYRAQVQITTDSGTVHASKRCDTLDEAASAYALLKSKLHPESYVAMRVVSATKWTA